MSIKAMIEECGNGLASVGDYVAGDDGELYVVTRLSGRIETQQSRGNCQSAEVELADWSDVDDDSEPVCRAIIGDEAAE